jgi:hypothetical protein
VTDKARRRELKEQARQNPPEAGVYRIVNKKAGTYLLGSAANLDSMRSKLAFARSTGSPSALDLRLKAEILRDGLENFDLEILDTLTVTPEMAAADIRAELATLEVLWRERLAGQKRSARVLRRLGLLGRGRFE